MDPCYLNHGFQKHDQPEYVTKAVNWQRGLGVGAM